MSQRVRATGAALAIARSAAISAQRALAFGPGAGPSLYLALALLLVGDHKVRPPLLSLINPAPPSPVPRLREPQRLALDHPLDLVRGRWTLRTRA